MKTNELNSTAFDSVTRLSILYEKQEGLLRLLRIRERNLSKLREQEALHGIAVPLSILNGIENETDAIGALQTELEAVDEQINEITRQFAQPSPENSEPGAWLEIDGANVPIVFPYPLLGQASEIEEGGQIRSVSRYVGGFELRTLVNAQKGTAYSFFRHGRQIAPLMDGKRKKIVIPIGDSLVVGYISMNLSRRASSVGHIVREHSSPAWTLVNPAPLRSAIVYTDWPQGSNDILVTNQATFENNYEVWMVGAVNDRDDLGVRLWFYQGDLLVRPQVDEANYLISFPAA